MGKEMFLAYWNGEEPTSPDHSPTLAQIPDTVDIVILFAAQIADGDLDFGGLVQKNNQATIMKWIEEIRERQNNQLRKTKFILSIFSDSFPAQDPDKFAQKVKDAVRSWGVDGVDIDYEDPDATRSIIGVVQAIRNALPAGSLLMAGLYRPWLGIDPPCEASGSSDARRQPSLLADYTALFDYIVTMDYTPYGSYEDTTRLYKAYAQAMGGDAAAYGKLAIGVSCMEFQGPHEKNHTPLEDVKRLCAYEPTVKSATKLGVMLYSLSYDAPGHGSPYPLFTYTKAIAENLP